MGWRVRLLALSASLLVVARGLVAVDASDYTLGMKDPLYWRDLARQAFDEGEYAAALSWYEAAQRYGIALDPGFRAEMGDAQYHLAMQDPESPAGRRLLGAALENYESAVSSRPEVAAYQFRMACIRHVREEHGEALKHVDAAIRLDGRNALYWESKASILKAMGDAEQAAACLRKARQYAGEGEADFGATTDPAAARQGAAEAVGGFAECEFGALDEQADAAFAAGRWEEAVELYEQALAVEPEGHPDVWLRLAKSYAQLRRMAEAEAAYARAAAEPAAAAAPDSRPADPIALRQRAHSACAAGDYALSISLWEEYLAQMPDDAGAWTSLANAYELAHQPDKASECLARARAVTE